MIAYSAGRWQTDRPLRKDEIRFRYFYLVQKSIRNEQKIFRERMEQEGLNLGEGLEGVIENEMSGGITLKTFKKDNWKPTTVEAS